MSQHREALLTETQLKEGQIAVKTTSMMIALWAVMGRKKTWIFKVAWALRQRKRKHSHQAFI